MFAKRVTLTRVTHFTHYPIYNFSIYWLFLSIICIGLHSVVDILVELELMCPGFDSRESHEFFFMIFYFFFMFFFFLVIIITVQNLQIRHNCLYSDSPTLFPLMIPRPPAPSALWFFFEMVENSSIGIAGHRPLAGWPVTGISYTTENHSGIQMHLNLYFCSLKCPSHKINFLLLKSSWSETYFRNSERKSLTVMQYKLGFAALCLLRFPGLPVHLRLAVVEGKKYRWILEDLQYRTTRLTIWS